MKQKKKIIQILMAFCLAYCLISYLIDRASNNLS